MFKNHSTFILHLKKLQQAFLLFFSAAKIETINISGFNVSSKKFPPSWFPITAIIYTLNKTIMLWMAALIKKTTVVDHMDICLLENAWSNLCSRMRRCPFIQQQQSYILVVIMSCHM